MKITITDTGVGVREDSRRLVFGCRTGPTGINRTEIPMTIKIPAAVARYLAADNAQDVEKICQCFTKDALVHEAGHQYQGRDAIRSWKQQTTAKYQYTVEPLGAAVTERNIQLHARLTGNKRRARRSRTPAGEICGHTGRAPCIPVAARRSDAKESAAG